MQRGGGTLFLPGKGGAVYDFAVRRAASNCL
jgi:hypothetical protein